MGSLPSPPPSSATPQSPGNNSTSRHRIYVAFCLKEPTPGVNVSNWIECYDPSNNVWSRVCSIPQLPENHVLKGFAMTSIGGSIYVVGGRLCRKERAEVSDGLDNFVEEDVEVRSIVLRYNVTTDEWTTCASLNTPRYDFAFDARDNKIFVAGGQSTLASAKGISSAEMYDPFLNEWTLLPSMSTLRYKCVGVTRQGKFHVVGGFAESGTSDRIVPYIDRSSAEMYDARSKRWDLVVGMWQLDVPPNQIVEVDGKLFSSGDCLNAWKGHIETYDGNLNIWYTVERSQQKIFSSTQRIYLTMAPVGTRLYFLAGYRMGESSRTISMVYAFDTMATGDPWRSFEPEEEDGEREFCSHCCVVQH